MFGIISAWKEHIRTVDELHYKSVAVVLRGLDVLIFVFQKTAEGETYYVNCTPEENRESHMHTAQAILDGMDELKKMDKHVYSILRYRYEDTSSKSVKNLLNPNNSSIRAGLDWLFSFSHLKQSPL